MLNRTTKVTLNAQIQGYVDGMKEAARATRETGSEAEKLAAKRQAFQTLGTAAIAVGGAITGIGIAALRTGISYNTLQQTSRAALTSLLGSAEAANRQMDKLDEFARTSPFAKQTFITAQQQMIAFGIEAKRVIPYLDAIQNAVAAAGGSNADIEALAEIFGKISASSKITAIDLMQFGRRGVNAAELIGSQMNKTGGQIRAEITAGTLDAGEALEALAAGMSERFDGAADNVKRTFDGAMDRVKAAWRDFSGELARPLVDPNGGGALVDLLNWAADAMRAFEALPGPVKTTVSMLTGLTGVALLAGGTFLAAVPKIAAFKASMEALELSGGRAHRALSWLGRGLAVGAAIGAFALLVREASADTERLAKALEHGARAQELMLEATASHSKKGWGHLYGEMNKVKTSAEDVAKAIAYAQEQANKEWWQATNLPGEDQMRDTLRVLRLLGDEFAKVASTDMPAMQKALKDLASEYGWTSEEIWAFIENSPELKKALEDQSYAFGVSKDKADLLKIAMGEVKESGEDAADGADSAARSADALAKEAEEAEKRLDGMRRALSDVASASMEMGAAQDKAYSAINKLVEAAADETATLYGTDDASIKLRDSIRDVEESHRLAAEAILLNDGTLQDALTTWREGREAVIQQRIAMGESREEATRWADTNLGSAQQVAKGLQDVKRAADNLPTKKNIEVTASGNALSLIQEVNAWLNATPEYKHISVSSSGGVSGLANGGIAEYANGGIQEFASGGFPTGIYAGGAPIHKFAEPETGWEAYISGRPSQRDRNRQIWAETGARLGVQAAPQDVRVSLEGARFVLNVAGRPVEAFVESQIGSAFEGGSRDVFDRDLSFGR